MDFVKRNLFFMVCGLGAIGGAALAFTGWRAMPIVQAEMKKVGDTYKALDGISSNPVNGAHLSKERQRIESVKEDHRKVLERAKSLQKAEPLVAEALPEGPPLKRVEFRKVYGDAMRALQDSLHAGHPASQQEIDFMKDRIADEELARKQFAANPNNPGLPPPEITGPPKTPANVLTKDGALVDSTARAHLAAAQSIYCYLVKINEEQRGPDRQEAGLKFDAAMVDVATVEPPTPNEVWRAQTGYWIQQDVVGVIVSLNEEAAKKATEARQHPWVGIMPVKEIISIRHYTNFITKVTDEFVGNQPGGFEPAMPPGTPVMVFTKSTNGPTFDVIQFSVKLVMDQRYITEFVERLCNGKFYTPLRISYQTIPVNRNMVGKIYGDGPSVMVVMDFEWILLGEVYRKLMPAEVREGGEIKCRPEDECPEA